MMTTIGNEEYRLVLVRVEDRRDHSQIGQVRATCVGNMFYCELDAFVTFILHFMN